MLAMVRMRQEGGKMLYLCHMTWKLANMKVHEMNVLELSKNTETHLRWKIIRYFFEAEENSTDGSTECNCDTRGSCGAEYLTALPWIMIDNTHFRASWHTWPT